MVEGTLQLQLYSGQQQNQQGVIIMMPISMTAGSRLCLAASLAARPLQRNADTAQGDLEGEHIGGYSCCNHCSSGPLLAANMHARRLLPSRH